jgi:hypothetical protein
VRGGGGGASMQQSAALVVTSKLGHLGRVFCTAFVCCFIVRPAGLQAATVGYGAVPMVLACMHGRE